MGVGERGSGERGYMYNYGDSQNNTVKQFYFN